jgi:hypothetical protein
MRREAAERYLSVALLSFAASVSFTRLLLALTGYPQIATGELHIAHVLWGGLLLFAAALLPLIIANRWVYSVAALLAGVGVGLFIDEVGKFITQRNDYFYPAAAPIVYTFFLLTIFLFLNVRRPPRAALPAELHGVLADIGEMLIQPATAEERDRLKSRLERLALTSASARHSELAHSLLKFVESDGPSAAPTPRSIRRWSDWRAARAVARVASDERLRLLLVVGLVGIGLLTLKNPVQAGLAGWAPPAVNSFLENLYAGRQIEPVTSPFWYAVRLALEWIVGTLLLVSAGLLLTRRLRQGAALGYTALLLSLTTVNLLLFYFEQFSTIVTTAIQFLLLLAALYYHRRLTRRGIR